jgi:glucose-6-phosphate isomerase
MESNGKQISNRGNEVEIHTCPVIFGEQGCNGQHAFHQLLHQGKHFIPVDFILVGNEGENLEHHHHILIGSGLSQASALMRGKSYEEAYAELKNANFSDEECDFLAKHKTIPGNRPSNIVFVNSITPRNLGALLALYEHKTFVQAAIWQINSFPAILQALNSTEMDKTHDSSTQGLIQHYKKQRGMG